jgi:hypothetical protein
MSSFAKLHLAGRAFLSISFKNASSNAEMEAINVTVHRVLGRRSFLQVLARFTAVIHTLLLSRFYLGFYSLVGCQVPSRVNDATVYYKALQRAQSPDLRSYVTDTVTEHRIPPRASSA